jgi:hypothetical protein
VNDDEINGGNDEKQATMTTQGDGGTDRKRNDDDVLGRFSHCDVPATPTNSLALSLNSCCRCSYHRAHVAAVEHR